MRSDRYATIILLTAMTAIGTPRNDATLQAHRIENIPSGKGVMHLLEGDGVYHARLPPVFRFSEPLSLRNLKADVPSLLGNWHFSQSGCSDPPEARLHLAYQSQFLQMLMPARLAHNPLAP